MKNKEIERYYFRDVDFLYPVKSHATYGFHTGKSQTTQVLMGLNHHP